MSRIDHHRPQFPDASGFFKKSYHLEMVTDPIRTDAVFRALRRALRPSDVFCELGCGTGIFSIYAAERCGKVYAVEMDPKMVEIAAENIRKSRFADRIELIHGDALEFERQHSEALERFDVVFCEMMSIWGIEEPQVPVANRARRDLLKPGGLLLPLRIVNLVELGHHPFRVGDIDMKAAIPLFTGVARPAVMTERRVCRVLDFSDIVSADLGADTELNAIVSGPVNCAILSSVVQLGPEVAFSGSDSLMPQTVVPLSEEISVKAGDSIRFRAAVRARSDMGEATFLAEVVEGSAERNHPL
jgi:predicted RNA methylase